MSFTQAFSPTTIAKDLLSLNKKQILFLSSMVVTMVCLSIYWEDSWVGITAGVSGVVCVFMVNMRKISNFFWGVINCTLYGYIAYTAQYYGDTTLNWLFYLPIQFIGAYFWSQQMSKGSVTSKKVSRRSLVFVLVMTLMTCFIYSLVLEYLGGSLSGVDASTTVLSVVATYLMVKGYREQWLCWILVNLLSIYMWIVASLGSGEGYGVLIMWVMFLLNSLYGTYTWFKNSTGK